MIRLSVSRLVWVICAVFALVFLERGAAVRAQEQPLTPIITRLEDRALISAGSKHSCALVTGGGVKCWGGNADGQLGDGTTEDRPTPIDVVELGSRVQAISAGSDHTCALTIGGDVKCWGHNGSGELGDGTTEDRSTPVDVVGLSSGVQAIAAGGSHTCALTIEGGVKCWGFNWSGELGDGTTEYRLTPVNTVGLDSGVQAIAAGGDHTCALTTAGVKCWGDNENGQLGNGAGGNEGDKSTTPVNVVGLDNGMHAIAAGGSHTCALTTGGVKCWGANRYGQLGDGTTEWNRTMPVNAVGLSSGVQAISAGGMHTCAFTTEGSVKCWGGNEEGQLGDGSTESHTTPVNVDVLGSGVQAIAAGWGHTCALITGSVVKCWGNNDSGQLGDGTGGEYDAHSTKPMDVVGLDSDVRAISAGSRHTCALTIGGDVKCWGINYSGELGNGTVGHRYMPVDVVGLSNRVQAVSAGGVHTCALITGGGVKCWGDNRYSQLGDGTTEERLTPVDVVGLSSGVQTVAAGGYYYTCALTEGGGVKCWGNNEHGQLGDGTSENRVTPVDVVGLTSGVQAISVGGMHTCALIGGGVKCWGENSSGQLGNGTGGSAVFSTIPVDVTGLSSGAQAVSAGWGHTCAPLAGGVKCWGSNYYGQLGDATTDERHMPVDVLGLESGVQGISAGGDHTCALTIGGAKCWGKNDSGQLGDGTTEDRFTPAEVAGLGSGVQVVAAGSDHTCVLTSEGGVKCWGANDYGQLSVNPGWTPVDVAWAMVYLPAIQP